MFIYYWYSLFGHLQTFVYMKQIRDVSRVDINFCNQADKSEIFEYIRFENFKKKRTKTTRKKLI